MTLLAGDALDPKIFFEGGNPQRHGSSFDLTIGCIIDHKGNKLDGPFTIEPGHMVQVVSAEVIRLSNQMTGHVTYKTTLTREGVWALTVGIVDPGWNGPIATTLLNFSKVPFSICEGDAFLRISFFEHSSVSEQTLRKAPPKEEYLRSLQKIAASKFPVTFLDTHRIAEAASKRVLKHIRAESLAWVVLIAVVFTIMQIIAAWFSGSGRPTMSEIDMLRDKLDSVQSKLNKLEQPGAAASAIPPIAPTSTPSSASSTAPASTALPAPGTLVSPPPTSSPTTSAPALSPSPAVPKQNRTR